MLDYAELLGYKDKGQKNRNWYQLGSMERVFYKAALWYARIKAKIINASIIVRLKRIFEKLTVSKGTGVMNAGRKRAEEMLAELDRRVFLWAPELKEWLKDPAYVFWLGLSSKSPHQGWIS